MPKYTYYSTGADFKDRYRIEHASDGFHVQKVISILRRPQFIESPYGEIVGSGRTLEDAVAIIRELSNSEPIRMRNPFPDESA